MYKYLIFLFFAISGTVNASFLLGMAVGSSTNKQRNHIRQSDLEYQVNVITKRLPMKCANSIYSSCWNQYSFIKKEFYVSDEIQNEVLSIFRNKGYNVSLKDDKLIFNFKHENENYLKYKKVFVSYETSFLFILLFIVSFYLIKMRLNYTKKIKKIKDFYNRDPNHICFTNNFDKKKFEDLMSTNKIPSNWVFKFDEEKKQIKDIVFWNGRQTGIVAYNINSHNEFVNHSLFNYLKK